jgi:hypothetical protein
MHLLVQEGLAQTPDGGYEEYVKARAHSSWRLCAVAQGEGMPTGMNLLMSKAPYGAAADYASVA